MKFTKKILILIVIMLSSKFFFGQEIITDTILAKKYFALGDKYYDSMELDSSTIYYLKSAKIYKHIAKEYADTLMWIKYLSLMYYSSWNLTSQSRFEESINIIDTAMSICIKYFGNNTPKVGNFYSVLAYIHHEKSEYDLALEYYFKTLQINQEKFGEIHSSIADTYNDIGAAYLDKDEYTLALKYYKLSLQIRLELFGEKNVNVAQSYVNIGILYYTKNDLNLCLKYFFKSLEIYKELKGERNPVVASIFNNIGNVYFDKKEFDLALEYHTRALNIKKDIYGEIHTSVANSFNGIGSVYSFKNEFDKALEYYFKSAKIKTELLGEKSATLAATYNNIGVVYSDKKEYDLGLEYLNKALLIKKDIYGEKHSSIAETYQNIGKIYFDKKEYNQALTEYFKALDIYIELLGVMHSLVSGCYIDIGELYSDIGDYEIALKYYQKGIASNVINYVDTLNFYFVPEINDYLSWDYLLIPLYLKAQILANDSVILTNLSALEKYEIALKHYQACDDLINKVRNEITKKTDKIALGEKASNVYAGAIDVCKKLIETAEPNSILYYKKLAVYFSEKNKSSVLLEALAGTEAQKFAGIPDTLLEKEHNLRIDIALYKKKLAEKTDSAKEIEFNDKLFNANRKYEELISYFESSYPKYFELKYNLIPASVEEIQDMLDKKTAMISYFTGDSSITIFTISKKNLEINTVPTIKNFADTIKYYRNGLIYINSSRFAEFYKDYAYKMYKYLISENLGKEIQNLIIIPDAELSMIPFETLLTEEANNKDWNELPYLVKKYTISYSYSANLFYKTFPKNPATKTKISDLNDWLAFAPVFDDSNTSGLTLRTREMLQKFDNETSDSLDTRGRLADGGYISPLPGTESEVQEIFKQFDEKGKKAVVQIKQNANEEFIKSGGLKNYKILHFATHGFVNTKKPELSGIFLAQDSTLSEDGILYQGEIYNLNLNADLTVLSACETGLGEIKKGEGLIGLTRALLYAGSKNIIVSLWKVADESTSDLMIDFYKNLLAENKESTEFSKALKRAKLKMIEEEKYAHPFYWSPFILIGK